MTTLPANATVSSTLAALRERYVRENQRSAIAHSEATRYMTGGGTRSVLQYEPFALTMARGEGSREWDIDGHEYIDCVGEFSAGLYGHSDPVIADAIREALQNGIVMAAPTRYERALAAALIARFPAVERLRFCNSGTEANLLSMLTARTITGRDEIMVFREGYHGGVFVFSDYARLNLPLPFVMADYNDTDGTAALIRAHRDTLAAVVVEPILGAGGNIPATPDFLRMLRTETTASGTILIFDEVKTSRIGPGGVQGEHHIAPDMTTFGKYLGGGLSSGAFGGRADIMARFDPASPNALSHSGTFNNNVCSMAAGHAGLTKVFTADRARTFLAESEHFRQDLNRSLLACNIPMQATGWGSLMTFQYTTEAVLSPRDLHPARKQISKLLHLQCLLDGVLLSSRGDIALSLPTTADQRDRVKQTILNFGESHAPLLRRTLAV